MLRKIMEINKEKCIGCGLCANACHERAIEMIDGKATLVKDTFCDGLGDCLPHCPTDAIKMVYKDVEAYSEEEVNTNLKELGLEHKHVPSKLNNWPPELKLAPVTAPYYNNAHLLIAADCVAFSYANFHKEFMNKRITLFGCSKLDNFDYTEKLANIFTYNNIKSITIVRMEVPCCAGLERMVKEALKMSGKDIHLTTRIISIKGEILECY